MDNGKIKRLVEEIGDWIIEKRRDFHRYPEPSTEEFETAAKIAGVLKELGVSEVKTGCYRTGVTGLIKGAEPGKTIALRFDMDALPMEEQTGLSFASERPGLMHGCGHDGHMAMGLGAARALMELREEIVGNIKLIFQPAEEDAPRGGGAQHMIKEGVLKDPPVAAIIGMHLWPSLPLGAVGTRAGAIMAASDPFTVDVIGKGVHASSPNLGIDPIVIAAQIVNNLQTIVSRNVDPFEQAVVSIGIFAGGTRYNIIPEKVRIEGTVRTFKQDVRDFVYNRMKIIVEKTAEAMGGRGNLVYNFGYPATINNAELVEVAKQATEAILGANKYIAVERPAAGGEDFAYFAQTIPGVFLWLGYGQDGKEVYPLHSPHFNFDEEALIIGTKVLVKTALQWGRKN
ncbi:MAG: M20 metallopeptidase family protein [bacterium]|jgi:amidohydrolase